MKDRTPDLAAVTVFVLAGGQGNRLYPLTVAQAKPAISFAGSACLLDVTLLNCLRAGVRRTYVLAQYRAETIVERIRTGWNAVEDRSLMATFVRLPDHPARPYRGTADAVWRNLDLVERGGAEDVLVLSGDHVYDMDYGPFLAFHRARGADLTIGASPVPCGEAFRYGVLATRRGGRVTAFREKPERTVAGPFRVGACARRQAGGGTAWVRASMGIYAFRAAALRDILAIGPGANRWFDFGGDIIPAMLGTHRVFAHDFFDDRGLPAYWRDVGTLTAYYEAQMDLVDQPATFRLSMPASLPHPRLSGLVSDPAARTLRDAGSVVAGSATCSVFSPRVVVEPGASVERAVILDGAVIESGAIVRDAVIGPFARVLCGAVVGGGPWAAAVCPPGRVYRTLGGVAVVPAHEVIGPERLGSRLAQAMPGFYTRTSQWEARSMAATCQPPRTASSAASSGMTTRSTG